MTLRSMSRLSGPALVLGLLVAVSLPSRAQTAPQAQEFPAGAAELSAAQIRERLQGKVFDVKLADGLSWRLEYNARGHFFVDVSNGFRGKGEWTAEDGRLCGQLAGRNRSCNEMRLHQDRLHLKRDSGEIIQFVAR